MISSRKYFINLKFLTIPGMLIFELVPIHFRQEVFIKSCHIHQQNTRQKNNSRFPNFRLHISRKLPLCLGFEIYKKFPPLIKSSTNGIRFKNQLRYLLNCLYSLAEFCDLNVYVSLYNSAFGICFIYICLYLLLT